MSRHKPTNPDTDDAIVLSPKQALAVDLLATGATVSQAAEASGVTRQTVSEWLHGHSAFRAALNRRRQELWAESADRIRALLPKALDVLGDELEGEKRLAAAVHIMRMAGLYGLPAPTADTLVGRSAACGPMKRLACSPLAGRRAVDQCHVAGEGEVLLRSEL